MTLVFPSFRVIIWKLFTAATITIHLPYSISNAPGANKNWFKLHFILLIILALQRT